MTEQIIQYILYTDFRILFVKLIFFCYLLYCFYYREYHSIYDNNWKTKTMEIISLSADRLV